MGGREKIWGKGFVTIGDLTFDSAAYVASYTMKKANLPTSKNPEVLERQRTTYRRYERTDTETGETWNVKPEYATMSRRPGLGSSWFEKYKGDIYPHDFAIGNGQKFRPPKYYDTLLEQEDKPKFQEIQETRRRHINQKPEEQTPERRDVS